MYQLLMTAHVFVMSLTLLVHSHGFQIKILQNRAHECNYPIVSEYGSNISWVKVFSIVCEFSIGNNFVSM